GAREPSRTAPAPARRASPPPPGRQRRPPPPVTPGPPCPRPPRPTRTTTRVVGSGPRESTPPPAPVQDWRTPAAKETRHTSATGACCAGPPWPRRRTTREGRRRAERGAASRNGRTPARRVPPWGRPTDPTPPGTPAGTGG